MATAPAPTAAAQPEGRRELVVISHSTLFYWWPVWALGFLMAGITWLGGERMITVPSGTKAYPAQSVKDVAEEPRDVLVLPKGKQLGKDRKGDIDQPHIYMSPNKNLGVMFCFVVLLVVAITNIPLRGLWSVIVIVILLSIVIILAILDKWEVILDHLGRLDIRISLGGYVVISSVLLALWLVIFIFFDKQIYMVFSPGQFRVRLEIGDAETAYDTAGMTIQKQRSDLFRHWILGLGSGDLIVRTAGAQAHQFDMPNVLFLGRKVREIEELLRSKQVVAGP